MKTIATKNQPNSSLLIEKIAVAVTVATLVLGGVSRAVAGPLYNEYGNNGGISNLDEVPAQTDKLINKSTKAKIKKAAAKTAAKTTTAKASAVKSSRSKNLFAASKNKPKSTIGSQNNKILSRATINKEIKAEASSLQLATASAKKNAQTLVATNEPPKSSLQYIRREGAPDAQNAASLYAMTATPGLTPPTADTTAGGSTTTKIEAAKPEAESPYSGSVNFTVGHDSNIDPDKQGTKGTFYQIAPTLNFKTTSWSGSFGASVKDFSDQTISNLNKSTDLTANLGYTAKLSEMATSTTTLDGAYHDEMWPDYIAGLDINQIDRGMPIRYTDGKLTEKLGFDFGNGFNTALGGYYLHRENSNIYSDYAANILDPRLVTQTFNEYQANARLALAANQYIEIAARPSITERDYTQRQGRQSDGTTGGWLLQAPLKKLLTTEAAFDLNFKVGSSSFGPTAMIGQVSDESLAGENGSYYGGGLKGDIVLNQDLKLTLSPSVTYKQINYDNWTNGVDVPGEKRIDHHLDTAINGKIMITKNIGWGVGYAYSNYHSNCSGDSSENFKEEVVSTTAIFSF